MKIAVLKNMEGQIYVQKELLVHHTPPPSDLTLSLTHWHT